MKTNQEYRTIKAGGYELKQRLSDGFFDIEHFFNQYKAKHPNDRRTFEETLMQFFTETQNFKMN